MEVVLHCRTIAKRPCYRHLSTSLFKANSEAGMFEGGKLTQAGQAVNKQLKGEISKQLPPNFIQKAKTAGQVKYMYFPEFGLSLRLS